MIKDTKSPMKRQRTEEKVCTAFRTPNQMSMHACGLCACLCIHLPSSCLAPDQGSARRLCTSPDCRSAADQSRSVGAGGAEHERHPAFLDADKLLPVSSAAAQRPASAACTVALPRLLRSHVRILCLLRQPTCGIRSCCRYKSSTDGQEKFITGTNVELSDISGSICAERSAVGSAL